MRTFPDSVTLRDVAVAAGVSLATASRVISGAGRTSPQAVSRVQAAARRLGYRPNPIARALRSTTTRTTGMIVPGIGNPFFAELVEAVENELAGVEQQLLLADSRDAVEVEAGRLSSLLDRRVDGLIVIPVHHAHSGPALSAAAASTPLVQVDRCVDTPVGDFVGVDNAAGIAMILDHLVEQGAREVTLVSGDASTSAGRARLDAFDRAVARLAGVRSGRPRLGEFTIEFGRAAVRDIWSQDSRETQRPDALVCGSDVIALGVVRELRELDMSVPSDVLVTGFDGIRFGEIVEPSLTTLEQPLRAVAAEAVRMLTTRLGGAYDAPRRLEITPRLIARQSTRRSG